MNKDYQQVRKIFYAQIPVQHTSVEKEALILEGCYFEDMGVGFVAVADMKTMSSAQSLYGSNAHGGCRFGYSFNASVDADIIAVGAPNYRHEGSVRGKIYLFKRRGVEQKWDEVDSVIGADDGHWVGFRLGISTDGSKIATCGYNSLNDSRLRLTIIDVDPITGKIVDMKTYVKELKGEQNSGHIVSLGIEKDEVAVTTIDAEHFFDLENGEMVAKRVYF